MTNTKFPQCKTCNMTEQVQDFLNESREQGIGFKQMAQELMDVFEIGISDTSLGNHYKKHVDTEQVDNLILPPVTQNNTPKGYTPAISLNEDGTGELVTKPQIGEKLITDFSDALREMGVDPSNFVVEGTLGMTRWEQRSFDKVKEEYVTVMLSSYRVKIREKVQAAIAKEKDVFLEKLIMDVVPNEYTPTSGLYTFVFAAGDLQLGKSDADGTEGIVKRYRESLEKAIAKVKEFSHLIGPILISWVGDCIEGMVSQGGKNARRTELTTTQQVRLLRKLMFETIKAFAPLTTDLQLVSVPGNHDEAQREPVTTDHSDSWAVDALVAVSEALQLNPEAFGHVTTHIVPFDEMTITIETSGTTITHAHGHQWAKGKHWEWWSGQHWGGHDIGKADILICGHFHSGVIEQENFKHMVRTPAFEKESTYFRHKTGKVGNPSAVSFLTRDGKLKYSDFE